MPDKKITGQKLHDLNQRLELLMINTEEPFVLVGTDYNVITFNTSFKEHYFQHFGIEFLVGANILQYAQSHRLDSVKEIYTQVFNGKSKEDEIEIAFPDDSKRFFFIKYKPARDESGNIIGAFVSTFDITDKKRSEEKQAASDKRFQALIENASEIISLTDKDGRIIYISPSVTKITGYSFDELKDEKYFSKMHPDYKKDSKKIFEESLQQPGVPIYRLNRLIHKNGSKIWMEGTVTNLLNNSNVNAIVSNFKNITERKTAEENLKQSENNLRAIFDNAAEGLMLLDKNCIIKAFNSKAIENNPMMNKDLKIGENLIDYIIEERKDYFKDIIKKVLNNETIEYDIDYLNIDGSSTWFHATLNPVKENNIITGICIARRNITKRKKTEEELRLNEIKYKSLSEELAISNTELEQFAYIASHDLQEPLRMITSFMAQLEIHYKDKLDEKAKQYIYFATDGAIRMRKIILDLLEYSLAGRKNQEEELINIDELLFESVRLNRKVIEETKAIVEWHNLPTIKGNRASLQQVFQNLIGNALKYQNKQNVPLIKINAVETDTHWQFSFSDNGIGIDAQFFEKIFVVFQRLHTREEFSGTGLGLAICKKIVENHNGKIWLESEINKGTTFYFTILK